MRRVMLPLLVLAATPLFASEPWTGTYTYDGSGNVRTITRAAGMKEDFRYDALGRLARTDITGAPQQSVAYDRYGNILSVQFGTATPITFGVAEETNRLTDGTKSRFGAYDDAGRLTSELGGVGSSFAYDGVDTVTRATVDGATKVHLYSAAGERIASVVVAGGLEGGSTWTFRDDDDNVIRRLRKDGAAWHWQQDYIRGAERLLAAEVASPRQTLHYFADHLRTPRLITANGGTQVAMHTYYPFGEEITDEGQDAEALKFSGHERDAASLDYMHARYYNPRWGRFLSVDPARTEAGHRSAPQRWNRYSYAANNPIKYVDPDGREIEVALRDPVFPAMVRTAMHPQGRADFTRIHRSPVRFSYSDFRINTPQAVQSMVQARQNGATVNPTTATTLGDRTRDYTSATVHVDMAAVAALHPDPTGDTTVAHENHHALGIVDNVPWWQIAATDPAGTAAAYGAAVAGSATDMTEQEAEDWLIDLLFPPERKRRLIEPWDDNPERDK